MIVKDLKTTKWAYFGMSEPFLYTVFHEEVLKVAGKDDDVIIHLSLISTKPAFGIALVFLISLV